MTASSFPPPPKVRESRFDDWLWRFHKYVDVGGGTSKWTQSGSNIYRATGSVGLGAVPPSGQSASFPVLYMGTRWALSTSLSVDAANAYFDGAAWKRIGVGRASSLNHGSGELAYYTSASSTADSTVTFTEAFRIKTTRETLLNPSYINVRQYGATGDGTTDDTTAISNALTDAASNSMRRVYFPQGTYRTTSALTIAGDWFIFGDGPSTSIIKVDHAGNGIVHTGTLNTYENEKLTIAHIGIRSNNASAGTAIKGTWTNSGGAGTAAQPSCLIFDVEVASNAANLAFTKGVELIGANHGSIEKLAVYGRESGIVSGSYGIYLDGAAGTPNLTDFKVRDCTIHYVETGAHCVDTEGVHFQQNTFLSCRDGIVFDTTLTIGKPYFDVTGNHFAVGRYGIYSNEMVQFIIGDNLIYGFTSISSSTTFNGIRIASGSNATGVNLNSIVRDNIILANEDSGTFSTQNYAIHVLGGTGTGESILFKGNKSENCDRLIYLDSSVVNTVIADDNSSPTGDTWEDASGLNSLPYGTYTPTGYGVTNCGDADITEYEANWVRVGNLVTVYGDVDVDPTAANASTTFRLSLPPECQANVSAATQCSGVISPSGPNTPSGSATMHTATNPDRVEFNFYTTLSTNTRMSYTYRYRTG